MCQSTYSDILTDGGGADAHGMKLCIKILSVLQDTKMQVPLQGNQELAAEKSTARAADALTEHAGVEAGHITTTLAAAHNVKELSLGGHAAIAATPFFPPTNDAAPPLDALTKKDARTRSTRGTR